MQTAERLPSSSLLPLAAAWLGLIALTLLSLGLGQWLHGASWLPPLVAAIIWLKGALVAHQFIEVGLAHSFIRRVVGGFIAFTPLALLGISYFGARVAGWASL
jgi:hypothetical protein